MDEIQEEINRLEQSEASYDTCFKLASLYVIRDRFGIKEKMIAEYSFSRSEFMQAVSDAPADGVLEVIDEHMEVLKILHTKEYNAIINKIKNLKY